MSTSKKYEPGKVPSQRPGQIGGARERNRQRRTLELCEAATKLFLERGVESATVDEITREAGVAKGSFYRYFEDKEQLVDALFAPLESEVEQAMKRCAAALSQASGDEQLNQAYATLAAELAAQLLEAPALVKLYLQECRAPAEGARKPIRRLSQKLMDGAIALSVVAHDRGLIRDLPPQVTAVAVVGAVEGMLVQYFEGHQLDVGEATAALISMVVDGIRKR